MTGQVETMPNEMEKKPDLDKRKYLPIASVFQPQRRKQTALQQKSRSFYLGNKEAVSELIYLWLPHFFNDASR